MTLRIPDLLPEGLLLAAVVFGPLAFGATEPWSVAILEGLLFALALSCALRGKSNWGHPIYRTMLPAAGILLLIGLAQFFNPRLVSTPVSLLPFTAGKEGTGGALILWGAYAALLFGAPQALGTNAALRRALWVVFLLGAFIAVVGLMQRGQGNDAYYGLRPIRHGNPFGPYTNKNHAASVLVLAAFAGAGLWLSRLAGIRRTEQRGKVLEAWMLQVLIAFLLAVIVLAIVHIRARGAIHAMALAAAIVGTASLGHLKRRSLRRVGAAAVAAAAAVFLGIILRDPFWIGNEKKESSAEYRMTLYRTSLEIARDFPVFGTGLGSYQKVFPAYWKLDSPEGKIEHAHNDWLELLTESGWAGLTAYLAGLLAAFSVAARSWWTNPASDMRCLAGACLAAALSFSLHGLVDFSFQIPANAVLFLTLLVCACGVFSRNGQPYEI